MPYTTTVYNAVHDACIDILEHYVISTKFVNSYGNTEAIETVKAGVIDAIDAFVEKAKFKLRLAEQYANEASDVFNNMSSAVSEVCDSYKNVDLQSYIRMYYADYYAEQFFSNNMSGYVAQVVIKQIFAKIVDVWPYVCDENA